LEPEIHEWEALCRSLQKEIEASQTVEDVLFNNSKGRARQRINWTLNLNFQTLLAA